MSRTLSRWTRQTWHGLGDATDRNVVLTRTANSPSCERTFRPLIVIIVRASPDPCPIRLSSQVETMPMQGESKGRRERRQSLRHLGSALWKVCGFFRFGFTSCDDAPRTFVGKASRWNQSLIFGVGTLAGGRHVARAMWGG